jgi:hypothetical protein
VNDEELLELESIHLCDFTDLYVIGEHAYVAQMYLSRDHPGLTLQAVPVEDDLTPIVPYPTHLIGRVEVPRVYSLSRTWSPRETFDRGMAIKAKRSAYDELETEMRRWETHEYQAVRT